MTTSILLQNVSTEDFKDLIKESVKSQLDDFAKELKVHNPDELLTREQTCEFLQIDSSTLWHYTKKGKVTAYGIGSRRYFKKAEILENGKSLIEFTQAKTNKLMTVPLHQKVLQILHKRNGDFPSAISDQRYNEYIKEVCKLANLTEIIQGGKQLETDNGIRKIC